MCHTINRKSIRRRNVFRRGMTLVELLIASAMLLLLAGVIGGLASAVQTSSHYSQGHADATQHARVALERMTREINRATATGNHAGMAVLAVSVLLFVITRFVGRRGATGSARQVAEPRAGTAVAGRGATGTLGSGTAGGNTKKRETAAPEDDLGDFREIEEILRRRGI